MTHIAASPGSTALFVRQTRDLIEEFRIELMQTSGVEPISLVVALAGTVLVGRHGASASWERFELHELFVALDAIDCGAPFILQGAQTTMAAFLAFLARRGVVSRDVAERAGHPLRGVEHATRTARRAALVGMRRGSLGVRRRRG